ncbi:MAG: hypothetical protein K6E84_04075 [Lachnospiraceae bacterium]|nr:hypothetical protein [Lachnospiraceae bacterium]
MKARILSYMRYIDTLLSEDEEKCTLDYQALAQEHLIQLKFFMHERTVHLYVMILFTLVTMADFFMMIIAFEKGLVILFLALLVLLIPYILHYYLLENSCQYMYLQYDEMKRRIAAKEGGTAFSMGEHPYRYAPDRSDEDGDEEKEK